MFHSSYAEERKRYHFHLHDHTQAKLRCRHDLRCGSTDISDKDTSLSSTLSLIRDLRRNSQRHSESSFFTSEKDTSNSSLFSDYNENENHNKKTDENTDRNESPLLPRISLALRRGKALVSGCRESFLSSTPTILE